MKRPAGLFCGGKYDYCCIPFPADLYKQSTCKYIHRFHRTSEDWQKYFFPPKWTTMSLSFSRVAGLCVPMCPHSIQEKILPIVFSKVIMGNTLGDTTQNLRISLLLRLRVQLRFRQLLWLRSLIRTWECHPRIISKYFNSILANSFIKKKPGYGLLAIFERIQQVRKQNLYSWSC